MLKTKSAMDLFLNSRSAKGLSLETIHWYKGILIRFAGEYPVLPHRPESVEEFLSRCPAGDERRHGYYRGLRAFYHFLEKRHGVKNVIKVIDPPKRRHKKPRFLTLDELDQLLSFPHPARIKAALIFLTDSGSRVGEAARLKPADITYTQWGAIATIDGKTGVRYVSISDSTYNLLARTLPFGYSPNRLCRKISGAFHDAHVKGTAHTLRHTFGTYWNGNHNTLKFIMGHANISTTDIYVQLRVEKMCNEHRQYSPLRLLAANKQLPLPFLLDK